jgi:hypothetical protein
MWNPLGIRFWGNIISGFEIFMGLAMMALGIYIGMFSSQMLNVGSTDEVSTEGFTQLIGIFAIVGSVILAMGASMITRASMYIDVTKKMEIDEIQQNRWALVILALGMSSFFLPMLIKRTHGHGVASNANEYPVRYSLGKWFSMMTLVYGIALAIGLVLFSTIQSDGTDIMKWPVFEMYLNNDMLGENADITKGMLYGFGALAIVAISLGILAAPAFWIPGSFQAYTSGTGFWRGYMRFFGVIFTIWCTILLVFAILSALLEILSAISRAFGGNNRSWLERILAMVMLPVILAIQGYIIMTCAQTMKGIWSRDDSVTYNEYSRLGTIQRSRGGAVNSDTAF